MSEQEDKYNKRDQKFDEKIEEFENIAGTAFTPEQKNMIIALFQDVWDEASDRGLY